MDISARLNRAIDYIEENLDGDIDLKYAAKLACCSYNSFSQLFLFAAGIQVSEYIRRRRLSRAALELQCDGAKIIDVALKYGYLSPTAFNRAFRQQHKVSPLYAKSRGVSLVTYPRLHLRITLKGAAKMNVRIKKVPTFYVVGIKRSFKNNTTTNLIPAFWDETPQEVYQKLASLSDREPKGLIGLCADFDGIDSFDYYIAVATTQPAPDGFVRYKVPAATFAILEGDGELWELHTRFWQEWLPSSGYRRANENIPDIELYFEMDMPKENYSYELWFPIVKE